MTEPVSDGALDQLDRWAELAARKTPPTFQITADEWQSTVARLREAEADRDAALARAVPEGWPRPFVLVRHEDETGVSTEQGAAPGDVVAWGVAFPDGPAVTRWCVSEIRQTAVFASVGDVVAIHGHGGKTQIKWMGDPDG